VQDWVFHGGYISQRTSMLYARPSLVEGVSRILDLGGTLSVYNCSPSPEEADFNALYSDWYAVGDDVKTAMSQLQPTG